MARETEQPPYAATALFRTERTPAGVRPGEDDADGGMLVVVNPAARNGAGRQPAAWLRANARVDGRGAAVRVVETERAGQAVEIARAASPFRTVVACGGDGLLHEVVQGLMAIPRPSRPALGVLPCGNGNDFARTVRMPRTGVSDAWRALQGTVAVPFDVGVCNGEHFLQTLSFGVDAAIALGTQRRRERTGHEGTRLFLEEGLDRLLNHRDVYACDIRLLDEHGAVVRTVQERVHLMAVQVGPTYGGGFAVCPDADPTDGAFDVCACRAPLGFFRATCLFLLAKGGRHRRFERGFAFFRAPGLRVSFDREPPVQIDGERLRGRSFDVRTLPGALDVLVANEGA